MLFDASFGRHQMSSSESSLERSLELRQVHGRQVLSGLGDEERADVVHALKFTKAAADMKS